MAKPLPFTPLRIKDVSFKARIVIAPMATHSAVEGIAQDFHFAHWGSPSPSCRRVATISLPEALVKPCWPQMAEIALGRQPGEAMDDWPVPYGWWLKGREWLIERLRGDAAAGGEHAKEIRQ